MQRFRGERLALLITLMEEAYKSIGTILVFVKRMGCPKSPIDVYLIVKNSDSEAIIATKKAATKIEI